MIWDDPWVAAATDRYYPATSRYATLSPPPQHPLPPHLTFTVANTVPLEEWGTVVRTRWRSTELTTRLAGAQVALLYSSQGTKHLVATCVLRRQSPGDVWLLETLRARPGNGRHLMRCVVRWLWDTFGPYILTYTWELSLPQLVGAYVKGWMRSAIATQYGWAFQVPASSDSSSPCLFCPHRAWQPVRSDRPVMPLLIRGDGWSVACSDSGAADDVGYVLRWSGKPDWVAICARGGWKGLWMRGSGRPIGAGWWWTGEFIVVGALNAAVPADIATEWITPEVA